MGRDKLFMKIHSLGFNLMMDRSFCVLIPLVALGIFTDLKMSGDYRRPKSMKSSSEGRLPDSSRHI